MRVRLIAVLLAAVAAVTMSGCGSESKTAAPAAAPSTGPQNGTGTARTAAAPADGAAQSAAPPDLLVFTATTIDRKPIAGVTLLGRPAVLWFWSAACTACRAQAAETDKAAALTEGRATVLGVAAAGEPAALRDFVTVTKTAAIAHISDASGALWTRFGVTEPGTYVILDSAGAVAYRGVLPRADGLLGRITPLIR
ncbi:redoxin domain-containing protein [Yinghuangia soli]|uniref:Redoxin domain-containing protein n=1 Tax=Yinghuangia soli TaxID=2908204 RepID=A0AA41Q898_9ACTN|nr:redoxin domain-containing protein [Yinghuangia soli]MCF2532551.1 redoxin domain-containing protein [Yinghuangia soli]